MSAPPLYQHAAGEEISLQLVSSSQVKVPRVVVIREEFIALTGNPLIAAVLNQLVYWSMRVNNFDLFLREEKSSPPKCRSSLQYGWFYKTSSELIEETMLCVTPVTLRRYLTFLEERGWIETRTNPQNKWDRTTQYRVNLRKLSRDLEGLGYTLPGFLKQEDLSNLQNKCFEEKEMTNEGAEHRISREEKKETSKSNNAFFDGEETSHSDGKKQSFESLENDLSKDKKMISRREKNIGCNTEITTENTNKEYTQRTRARAREDSKFFGFSKKDQIESVSQAMVKLWQKHIRNEDLHPTKKRSHLLEAALQLYFKNDLKKWEVFCLRIKSSAFLMGEGPRKWYATLDWILEENNLIKVLEGNFDNRGIEGNRVWEKQEEELNLEKNQQKESVISSIKDSIWRDWCSQLAKGVPLHKDRIFHEPLSLFELTEIANARFIECEEDRLIWIGSSDQTVLNAIERGRFKINWVFENQYPKARTIRTRLEPLSPSQNSVSPQQNPGPFRVEQPSTLTRGQTHA